MTVRLFAGAWPPDEVAATLGALARPAVPGVRWTTAAQWHVTLAFLGDVDEAAIDALGSVLGPAIGHAASMSAGPLEVALGPATVMLGRGVLCVPVAGLDTLAAAIRTALAAALLGPPVATGARFRGHLTLARARGRHAVPSSLVGMPVSARWVVEAVCLVRSELAPGGARDTTIAQATVPSEVGRGPAADIPHRTGVRH